MEIYACGESVSRRNSSESEVLFSLKQEAPASIGGGTFTIVWSNKLILEQNEFATIDKPIDAEQFTPIILSKCILNSLGVHDEEQV